MRGWEATTLVIMSVSGGVVEDDVLNQEVSAVGDGKAMDGIILDIEVLDHGTGG